MIGYSLPKKIIQKFHIDNLRVYAEAMNLFIITKYSGLDPEITGDNVTGNENSEINNILRINSSKPSGDFGIDWGTYPNGQKQYLIGLNINF